MNFSKIMLNSCGWVYLRTTEFVDVYKIGKTDQTPTERAGTNKSDIIRINKSFNNNDMETYLKKKFKKKYKIYKGSEYFIANYIDITNDYDEYFIKFEKRLLEKVKEIKNNNLVAVNIGKNIDDIKIKDVNIEETIENIKDVTIEETIENIKDVTIEETIENIKDVNIEETIEKIENINCNIKKQIIYNSITHSHLKTKKFECDKCGQKIKSKQSFKYHLDNVKCEEKKFSKIFQCDECNKGYTQERYLVDHKTRKHPNELEILKQKLKTLEEFVKSKILQ
jgi:hypothetical protein